MRKSKASGIRNVTLTGGEPLQQDMIPLLQLLAQDKTLLVHVETNGSIAIGPFQELVLPRISAIFFRLPKLPASGMESQMCLDNLQQVCKQDVYKFGLPVKKI